MPAGVQHFATFFAWTGPRLQAAQLLAEGELTDKEVALKVVVDRVTLWRWRQHPAFQARVAATVDELGEVKLRYSIGLRGRRLRSLDDRYEQLLNLIRERAADPAMQGVSGGRTGLLVRKVKVIGRGAKAQVVETFVLDTALLRALLALEKQAAIEVGDWDQ
jgi:hypothetical protein